MTTRRFLARAAVTVTAAAAILMFLTFVAPATSCAATTRDPQSDGCYIPGVD
jgi:hypothetical protein